MQAIGFIVYIVVGIFQLAAIMAGLSRGGACTG